MEHTAHETTRSVDVTGLSQDAVRAIEALVAVLRGQPGSALLHSTPYEEWSKAFREWVRSHPERDTLADDSRESIYAGRGE